MSEIDYIIRNSSVLKPEVIREIDYNNIIENLKVNKNLNLYILLPVKFRDLNLLNAAYNTPSSSDSALLFLAILVKRLVDNNVSPLIVLDSVDDISQLQEISRTIQYVEKDEYGGTSTGPFSDIRFVRSNDLGYKTFYTIYKQKRVSYSEYTKDILVSLQGEDVDLKQTYDVIIYLKKNEQFYASGFPRLIAPEYRIYQDKKNNCPLVTVITDTLSIPRQVSKSEILYISTKTYIKRKLDFEAVNWESYFTFENTNKKIMEILNDLTYELGKLYFCAAILFILYNEVSTYNDQINESLILRITDNLSLRVRIKDLFQELTEYKAELGTLKPNITSWLDIYIIRKNMERQNIKIQFAKPLEKSMVSIFEYLFLDIITLNKLFALSKGISDSKIDFEDLRNKTNILIKKSALPKLQDEKPQKEFDPEAPIGYIASEYKTSENKGPVEGHYFILEAKDEKYIFYCQLGKSSTVKVLGSNQKKSLDQLKVGDVIEKKYWNYQLLKSKIFESINKGKIEESEDLIHDIEESDSFRLFLEKYALSKSNSELNSYYAELVNYGVKNLLRTWSIDTMCPTKKDLFRVVTGEINNLYNLNLDADILLKKFRQIKSYRKRVRTEEDTEETVGYKIVEGPIKITVEVEKLGRIYRLS